MKRRSGLVKTLHQAGRTFSVIFLRGLVVVLPIALTLMVLGWLIGASENFLGVLIRLLLPELEYWPGLGILFSVALILVAGIMMNARSAQRLLGYADSLLARIPVVKTIYLSIRDIATFMSGEHRKGFSKVVAVRIQQMRLIGFVTTESPTGLPADAAAEQVIGVYLPMSYGIGGYTVYVPKALVEPLEVSLEDAMRITMSGGVSSENTPAAKP